MDTPPTLASQFNQLLRRDRWFAPVFCGLLLLHTLPLMLVVDEPMQDRPGHLSMVTLWEKVGSGSTVMDRGYEQRSGLPPYLTYYSLMRGLSYVLPIESANKLLLALYVWALPVCFMFLLMAFGKDPRYAIFSIPFVYNVCFIFGFIPNILSYPLFLLSLLLLKRMLDRPSLTKEVLWGLTALLLYFTHLAGFMALAVCGPIVLFSHVRRVRQAVRCSLFALPAVAVALYWFASTFGEKELSAQWSSVPQNVKIFFSWMNNTMVGSVDDITLLVLALTAGACLLLPVDPSAEQRGPSRWALGAAGLALLVVFFVTPSDVFEPLFQMRSNARLVVPTILLLLTIPARGDLSGWRRLVLLPLVLMLAWNGVTTVRNFVAFDKQANQLEIVLRSLPANQRVLPLLYDGRDGIHRSATLLQLPMMYIVRKGGYLPYTFAGHPVMPVKFKDDKPLPAPHWTRPQDFDFAVHGRYYDYFLAVHPQKQRVPLQLPTAGDAVVLVVREGRMALYKKVQR
jgi:hypothetical protein